MQNSQVWTSTYRSDIPHQGAAPARGTSPVAAKPVPFSRPPSDTGAGADRLSPGTAGVGVAVSSPTLAEADLAQPPLAALSSPSSRMPSGTGIWSPLYGTSRLRAAGGGSFGAYGAYNSLGSGTSSHRSSDASQGSFDSELYRNGGVAWGSAARHASFPSAEPAVSTTPADREPMFASLSPLSQTHALGSQHMDFTAPSFSILERFSSLADATRAVESADASASVSPVSAQATLNSAASPQSRAVPIVPVVPIAPGPTGSPAAPVVPTPATAGIPKAAAARVPSTSTSPQTPRVSPNIQHLKASIPVPVPKMLTPPNEIEAAHASAGAASGTAPVAAPGTVPGAAAPGTSSPRGSGSASRTSPRNAPMSRRKRGDSPLLDHFRSPQSQQLEISSVLGRVLEASTDQYGSRFIQDRLASAPEPVRRQFFVEALPHVLSLATDVFGNYVVQLLIEQSSPEDQEALVACLKGSILTLSLQMYGCRVVQIALRNVSAKSRGAIVAELKGNIIKCVKDHNGNHVVQKAVEYVNPEAIHFIYDDILSQPLPLARHMYGCRVIQRALEYSDKTAKAELLRSIRENLELLTLDQYGNYVVQHVVENGPYRDREYILGELIPRVVELSGHKFASNVIEKCFIKGSPSQRREMVRIITTSLTEDTKEPVVLAMMRDQYANYVIQRILGTAKNEDYDMLARAVKKNLPIVKKGQYGKHLQAIERRLK